jgi:hypothetical protein
VTVDPRTAIRTAEDAYLDARQADDRREVARRSGSPEPPGEVLATATAAARTALARIDQSDLEPGDRRAVVAMERGLASLDDPGGGDDVDGPPTAIEVGFAENAESLPVGDEAISRLALLGRLAAEADGGRRHDLFLALEPLWRLVDGHGDAASPYRSLLEDSAARWATGASPHAADARALGIDPAAMAEWCEAILEAWRGLVRHEPPVEPWDWWWANGELTRLTAPYLGPQRLRSVSDAWHRALGADPSILGVVYDVEPRPGRPPVPVAETVFGGRPRQRPDGGWSTGSPTVFATYTGGGLGELVELIHETGHAIHIAAIRTRPAFTEWPDSDALTEAIAELTAMDAWRPAWLARWLGADLEGLPAGTAAARGAFAEVAMDAAWALLEIRLHADPSLRPNDVWTEITSTWLGIIPHPEWSWWAIRGQLVESPGYMVNYPVGAILAADLRAAIRAARGDWIDGDPGWYGWVSDRLLRFGLARPSGDVVRELLGRAPSPDALMAEILRASSS